MFESNHTVFTFTAQEKYLISERISLLEDFRSLVVRMGQRGARVSPQALSDLIDDVFNTFSHWTSVENRSFAETSKRRLDPHTIRKLLQCDLDLELQKMHAGSFRVIDVFLQILEHDPPKYLLKYLSE